MFIVNKIKMNPKNIKSRQDFDAYINKTPFTQVIEDFYETILANQQMMNEQPQKIKITVGQFLNLFDIQGYRMTDNGEIIEHPETRGRKKRVLTAEERHELILKRREYQKERYRKSKEKESQKDILDQ